jgi:CBS domain containing-hemolysin-like protein
MLGVALQIAVIVVLTLTNGLFAMSETTLVSSRKAQLRQRAEAGDRDTTGKTPYRATSAGRKGTPSCT